MIYPDQSYVEGVPSGLCSCRLGGESMHIAAISPRGLYLRTPERIEACGALQLLIYRPEQGTYDTYNIESYETGQARRENGAVLTRFSFDHPACAAAIRRMLNDYARFLEIKSEAGASAYAEFIAGYPADQDDVFCASPEEQRKAWSDALPPLPEPPPDCELAVELNCPELWKLYLDTPLHAFMDAYAESRSLKRALLPNRAPDRLYVGSAVCRHLFPNEDCLKAIAAKANADGLKLTLVSAELRAGGEVQADRLIQLAAELNAELAVNDWGMLQRAQAYPKLRILLGTQLNRRRKDPRMSYKRGMEDSKPMLAHNALNGDPWRSLLNEMGIVRYEYESCGLPTCLPDAACSLHLPFYQTNTALWCPLKAICERGSRGAQADADACPAWCEDNVLLYPKHLNMIGRWNSLFALDLSFPVSLPGFDRLVLNF